MLLLSKKSFEECRKDGIENRANRISLTRWKKKKKIESVVVEIVVCLIATNFNHSANPIAREFHPVWQMRKITLFFSFFLEFHQLLRTSRFQTSFHISPFQQSSNQKEERRKQIQNMLCKCGWDFDHFDQFDQNHAFSNHNPKRMTIGFVLRELLTIIKHCKNEKQNEWSWNFISFLVCFHHCRKEKKEKIVKFIFILQQTTSIHSHSFNIIKPITINHNQTTMRMRRGKGENEHHQQPSNKSKPHRLTRAWREGENKLHSPNYPLFQHSVTT